MRIILDQETEHLVIEDKGDIKSFELYSKEAFEILSKEWLKIGWNLKHIYTFTWMGRPIIQLPEDIIRIQELIYKLRPDIIIETGIAHGGSLVFYASLCKLLDHGRVIGIDIEIRPHNRIAISNHILSRLITLIEGNSIAQDTIGKIQKNIKSNEVVLVILDSNHTKNHVKEELEKYSKFVTMGSYIIVADGIMQDLYNDPRGKKEWAYDNPIEAIKDFISCHPEFIIETPQWLFNESSLKENITHWPQGWLKRIS